MLEQHVKLRILGRIFYSQKRGGRKERCVVVADAKIAKELVADAAKMVLHPHLTGFISWMVLASQLPHKLVYLLFDNLFDDFKLTIV